MRKYTYSITRIQQVEILAESIGEAAAALKGQLPNLEPIIYPITLASITDEYAKPKTKASKESRKSGAPSRQPVRSVQKKSKRS